jgi:hypothetical protein
MDGDEIAPHRRAVGIHKYLAQLFTTIFLTELAFCAWALTVGSDPILWLLLAGGLAGLVPAVLNGTALWRAHDALRDPGHPESLAVALRTAGAAYRLCLIVWIVPLAASLLLEFYGDGDGMYLLGIMMVIPIVAMASSAHTTRQRLTRARDALVVTPLPGG